MHNVAVHKSPTNPFTFGDLALDEAFTDREDELQELASDMRNGQNVLVYAPRRYGKSSLVLRAAQEAMQGRALVGYCDVMKTPTKERLAAALAKTIYADIASPVGQAFERAAELFRGLRVRPTMEVDSDGMLRFTFQPGRRKTDIDETIERLLELLGELAGERKRRVVIIFDEFQEIVSLDAKFPNLMRAVFQGQPEVSHVYLGSKQHILERIFNDRNEPFWRSAKQLEIGTIAPAKFAPFIRERFLGSGKSITDDALERLFEITGGHPYGTQELAYFVWELLPSGTEASVAEIEDALSSSPSVRAQPLRATVGRRTSSAAAPHGGSRRGTDEEHLFGRVPRASRASAQPDPADGARGRDPEGDRRQRRRRRLPGDRAVPGRVAPTRAA